mgnify:CR=1 FL=1
MLNFTIPTITPEIRHDAEQPATFAVSWLRYDPVLDSWDIEEVGGFDSEEEALAWFSETFEEPEPEVSRIS